MRIGVDIDGVLNYRQEFVLSCGTKFCVEQGLPALKDPNSHSIREIFGISQAQRDEFWRKYARYQMWEWPAQNYAAEVIKRLRDEGHEIFIVTGRNNNDPRVEGMPEGETWETVTVDWLKRNNIIYDQIEFDRGRPAPHDKGTYCQEQGIEVMIEDLPAYLETLVGKTQIFVFDQPYNRGMELAGMQRVYSWYDIYQKIEAIAKAEGGVR